jgi:hypothetical protein
MDAAAPSSPGAPLPHSCARGEWLCQRVDDDQLDAAIEAGLMQFVPCAACGSRASRVLCEAQDRLRQAWEARDRHLARNARLAARAETKAAERGSSQGGGPGLSSAAAAALERARAKAGSKQSNGA